MRAFLKNFFRGLLIAAFIVVAVPIAAVIFAVIVALVAIDGDDGPPGPGTTRSGQSTVQANERETGISTPFITVTAIASLPSTSPAAVESPTPTTANSVIQGLSRVDVTGNLESRGFDCAGQQQLAGTLSWVCERTTSGGAQIQRVDVQGPSSTRINYILATIVDTSATDSIAADFLGFIATVPYDDAEPARARDWVKRNIGVNEATITIGSAEFRILRADTGMFHSLTVTAVGY